MLRALPLSNRNFHFLRFTLLNSYVSKKMFQICTIQCMSHCAVLFIAHVNINVNISYFSYSKKIQLLLALKYSLNVFSCLYFILQLLAILKTFNLTNASINLIFLLILPIASCYCNRQHRRIYIVLQNFCFVPKRNPSFWSKNVFFP